MLAGPGTGKTATLVEAVAERIADRHIDPGDILVLTFSRRAAAELSERIVGRLGLTSREPMVRTLHSYAFSLVRAQAARAGEPAPRLIAAAESDQVIRELLTGHADHGGREWPEFLHGALRLRGFAESVRDLLARSTERGLSPAEISNWGRRRRRPEWVALGRFATEYSRVLDLRTGTTRQGQALDQAELMGVALGVLAQDAVLAVEQARVRRIFVDEYQDVDPAQARLIDMLSAGADELVVVGDPDQSIYAFRGSDPAALRDVSVDHTVALTSGRRMSPVLTTASRRVATLLPGPTEHRRLTRAGDDGRLGTLDVRVLPTAGAEATYVADQLRRAHLLDGVPWSQMAVLVRSPAASLPLLRRAFAVAGVPLVAPARALPIAEDSVVAALLLVLACGVSPLTMTAERAAELMSSPLGALDALALRRLRRALRSARPGAGNSMDLLAAILLGGSLPPGFPADLAAPVAKVAGLIALVAEHIGDATAEQVLWQLWQATGLATVLVATSNRGGLAGQRADATLDAVILLCEAAADRANLLPGAGLEDFIDSVIDRSITDDGFAIARSAGETVSVLSAHAAKGLEWDVVAIAGVQEGTWPNTGSRGDILGTRDLLDLAAGIPLGLSRAMAELADERRLFYVAATRARLHLIATAVSDAETQPSRFLVELAGTADLAQGLPTAAHGGRQRGLNVAELIADLRQTVTAPDAPHELREQAAEHLANLAAHRIRGADPRDWWGLSRPSTSTAVADPNAPIRISPSAVEGLQRCSLRAVLERIGGRGSAAESALEGMIVHALAHGIALGLVRDDLVAELDTHLEQAGRLAPWQLARLRRLILTMTDAAMSWYQDHHDSTGGEWSLVGSEVAVAADLPPSEIADGLDAQAARRPVIVAGRADLISRDQHGRPIIIDFKTGTTAPSEAETAQNPQLAGYQVAVGLSGDRTGTDADGDAPDAVPALFPATADPGRAVDTGGAKLVFLRTGSPRERSQPPLSQHDRRVWIGTIRRAADQLTKSVQTATQNKYCEICPVRTSCPVQEDGRQVLR